MTDSITQWEIGNVYSLAGDSLFQMNMVVTIAEDPADSVIKMGETVVAKLNVCRNDFEGGYMYVTFGTFQACMMTALIYQDIEVATAAPENGTISAEQNDAAVVVTLTPDSGYELDALFVNDKEVEFTERADGTCAVYFDKWEKVTITAEFMKSKTPSGDDNTDGDGNDNADKSGCKGAVAAVGPVAGVVLIAGAAVVLLRKKRSE